MLRLQKGLRNRLGTLPVFFMKRAVGQAVQWYIGIHHYCLRILFQSLPGQTLQGFFSLLLPLAPRIHLHLLFFSHVCFAKQDPLDAAMMTIFPLNFVEEL